MGKSKLDGTYISKISIKSNSFDVSTDIKIPFFLSFGYYYGSLILYSSLPRTVWLQTGKPLWVFLIVIVRDDLATTHDYDNSD
jgi:hypothetical protein